MGAGRADSRALTGPSPLVVLVGCPAALVSAFREAGSRLSVSVQERTPGALHAAHGQRPFVIVVPEEIYGEDPAAFDALTRQESSSLLRLPARVLSDDDAQPHLVEAVLGAATELLAETADGAG